MKQHWFLHLDMKADGSGLSCEGFERWVWIKILEYFDAFPVLLKPLSATSLKITKV